MTIMMSNGDGGVLELDACQLFFPDNSMRRMLMDSMYCLREAVKRFKWMLVTFLNFASTTLNASVISLLHMIK